MLNKTILFKLLFFILVLASLETSAQTPQIDTIVVDLATDTLKKKNKEVTPTLNLDALRNAALADSARMVAIAKEKKEAENKKVEELKAKRKIEKEEKEKQLKALAEKRKLEKEVREKALAEKKAKRQAEERKKKEEKKLAKEKAKAEQKLDREKRKKAEKLAKKTAEERKKAEQLAEKNRLEKLKLDEQKEITEKKVEEKKKKLDQPPIKKVKATVPAVNMKESPIIPDGVVQKDNAYGTVRLAYDELAASFLLTIPTETKMHYHKDHSEHIMLIEGNGMVLMGYKTIKLKKNELIFITKGTPHKIINNGKGKLKILSIQSPFYSGRDIIILE